MNLFAPPSVVEAKVFSRMPDALRRPVRTAWADFNKAGQPVDCFLEGPSFDAAGNLVVTDIPHGRIFKVSPSGTWSQLAEYDGWPNGLKFHADGRAFITDYKRGIMTLDMASGKVTPLIETMRTESFKGVNDLHFASERRSLFHRPGPDRAARSDRTRLPLHGGGPAHLPRQHDPEPERHRARPARARRLRRR